MLSRTQAILARRLKQHPLQLRLANPRGKPKEKPHEVAVSHPAATTRDPKARGRVSTRAKAVTREALTTAKAKGGTRGWNWWPPARG